MNVRKYLGASYNLTFDKQKTLNNIQFISTYLCCSIYVLRPSFKVLKETTPHSSCESQKSTLAKSTLIWMIIFFHSLDTWVMNDSARHHDVVFNQMTTTVFYEPFSVPFYTSTYTFQKPLFSDLKMGISPKLNMKWEDHCPVLLKKYSAKNANVQM